MKKLTITIMALGVLAGCALSLYELRSSDAVPVEPTPTTVVGCTGSASVVFNGADTGPSFCPEEGK